jgi:L-rhamnose-H+ transport protein
MHARYATGQGIEDFMTASLAMFGAILAVVSGIMNGVFALPMRYLGRWDWENVWLPYIVVACLLLPAGIVCFTVAAPMAIFAASPVSAIVAALVCGSLWGFGAIMFGQAVSAVGISLTNTIALAISASLGSLLPMFILNPSSLSSKHGLMVLAGTAIAIVGMVVSGKAGTLREKNHRALNKVEAEGEGTLVGRRRPMRVGMILCIGAGILSAVFNIGFSFAQPIIAAGIHAGHAASDGTNLVWLLLLGSGGIVNVIFCVYLLIKNGSARKFLLPGLGRLSVSTLLMGLFWGGAIFVYGEASTRLGSLGPALGWPLFLTTGLLVSNVCGVFTGEWKSTAVNTKWWMGWGLVLLAAAILVLGEAGTM